MTEFTFASVWTAVGTTITALIDQMGDWIDAITGNPVLLTMCIVLPLVGIGISIFKRLLRTRV